MSLSAASCQRQELVEQVNEMRVKSAVAASSAKSSETELARRKANMEELARQLQIAQRTIQATVTDKIVLTNELSATKEELLSLHDRFEVSCSEVRELKVWRIRADCAFSVLPCHPTIVVPQMKLTVLEQKWSASERALRLSKEETARETHNCEALREDAADQR